METARDIYERTVVGHTNSTPSQQPAELEAFQRVVGDLESLEQEGLIEILQTHRESSSGYQYVDLVMFRRLR